mgnify:CR=1 FL=1
MGWLARKLGAGSTPLGGKTVYQTEGVPFLRSQNVHNNGLRLADVALISPATHARMSGTHIQSQDILLNITGASIGRCAIVPNTFLQGNVSQHVAIIRLHLVSIRNFIHLSLIAPTFQKLIDDVQVGVSREGLSMQSLRQFPMLIPPLAEQHRIVAKVEELMALCDRLEAAQAERERRRDRLAAASLHRLNQPADATDPELFRAHARFYINHLPRLTTRPEHIKQLRQTILNLAVRGKLVPQDPNDEPASEILRRLRSLSGRSITAKSPPKRNTPQILHRATGLMLPPSWETVALGDVCSLVTSGSRGWAEFYSDTGPKFIRAQNIRFGCLRLQDLACVTPPANSEGSRTSVSLYDLLVVITGAGVTNPAMVDRDLGEAYVSQHVALVRPSAIEIAPWLLLCLMAPNGGRNELVELAYGSGKPGLNLDNIRSLPVPFPSTPEQARILSRLAALLAHCDELQNLRTTADAHGSQLLSSILNKSIYCQSDMPGIMPLFDN